MKNNRGQVLVLFVLLIPLLMIMFVFFLSIGEVALKEKEVRSNIDEALNYASTYEGNDLKEKVEALIRSNISNIEYLEIKTDKKVSINITYKINTFGKTYTKSIKKSIEKGDE